MLIFTKYILKETVIYFVVTLLVLISILFLARSLKLAEMVVSRGVPFYEILFLFACIIPSFLEISIPIALLIGTAIAFSRFSSENELIAMRSVGLSLRIITKGLSIICLTSLVTTLLISNYIRPKANAMLGAGLYDILKKRVSASITEGDFSSIGKVTIYTEKFQRETGKMNKVLFSDGLRSFFATDAALLSDPNSRNLSIKMFNGSIIEGTGGNSSMTDFSSNLITIPLSELTGDERDNVKINEYSTYDLILKTSKSATEVEDKEILRQSRRLLMELYKRFSIPFSSLFVPFLGLIVGSYLPRFKKGIVFRGILGISAIIFYYAATSVFSAAGENGQVSPLFAAFIPNIVYFIGTFILVIKAPLYRE